MSCEGCGRPLFDGEGRWCDACKEQRRRTERARRVVDQRHPDFRYVDEDVRRVVLDRPRGYA